MALAARKPRNGGGLQREAIAAQHRRLVARDVLVVSIVGASTWPVLRHARPGLRRPAVQGAVPERAEVTPQVPAARRLIDLDVPQTVLQFATPGVKRDDPDYLAAYVMNHSSAAAHFSSRLFQKVREQKGLAYSVSTQLSPWPIRPLSRGRFHPQRPGGGEPADHRGRDGRDRCPRGRRG